MKRDHTDIYTVTKMLNVSVYYILLHIIFVKKDTLNCKKNYNNIFVLLLLAFVIWKFYFSHLFSQFLFNIVMLISISL